MKIFLLFLISLVASKLTLYGGEKPADTNGVGVCDVRYLRHAIITYNPELCLTEEGRWGQLNLAKCDL